MRILLIEDGELTRRVIGNNLTKLGHTVDYAVNGEQALIRFDYGYDLILLDIGLPDISGYTIARIIRAKEKHINAIVGITTDANQKRRECIKSGFDAVYNKPINVRELEPILSAWGLNNDDEEAFYYERNG